MGQSFGPDAPPSFVLMAGIHGNEFNGTIALSLLARDLHELEAAGAVTQTVFLVGTANPFATDVSRRCFPFEDVDLHCAFDLPEDSERSLEERLVAPLKRRLRGAAVLIDIHSSNSMVLEAPQARYYAHGADPRAPALRSLAMELGLPIAWEKESNDEAAVGRESPSPIDQSAVRVHAGLGLFIQAGMAGTTNLRFAGDVASALKRALVRRGLIRADIAEPREPTQVVRTVDIRQIQLDRDHLIWMSETNVDALRGGLFVASEEILVGQPLTGPADMVLGELLDPVTGGMLARVVKGVDEDCFVLSLRVGGLAYPGALLARLVPLTR